MSILNKHIGENIKTYREKKGFSQGDLARKLRVDRSYVSTLEKGLRNPSIRSLEKFADILGVTVAAFVETLRNKNSDDKEIMKYMPGLIESKESGWKGKKWYHQRFDGAPYLIHMIGEAQIITRREKKHGLFFSKHFCFFRDGKADWYMDIAEIEDITGKLLAFSKTNPAIGKKLMQEYEPLDAAFYTFCKKIEKTNLYELTDKELVVFHDSFLQSILNRNGSSSIIDGFALGSDKILEENIRKAYQSHVDVSKTMPFTEVFTILTTPPHSSFVRDAELELFTLILKIRTHKEDKKKLIREYRDKYFWIRNNYIDANVLNISYFEEEIARIESSGLDVGAEVKRIEMFPDEAKKKKELLLKKLNLSKETLFLLSITEDFTQWQDERKKATMLTAHYCTLILDEIGRRIGISADLLKYMSPREISRIFAEPVSAQDLEERRNGCVMYWDTEGHEVVTGDIIHTLQKKLLGENTFDDIQDFRGMTASLGKAQGRVKVLKSAKEVDRIEQGDVLVAVMTRPDYVSAMKKAVAIVTDEGGITSHAAIVSREIKIPCVIGTKIATQVLRDGDLVEVNANHGVVKILERAKVK